MSTGLVNTAVRLYRESGGTVPRGHRTLLRSVHGDFTSSRGFRWPFPGGVAVAHAPVKEHKGACPSVPGDGLCLGKTWAGVASGGIPASTLLLCAYRQQDVLGEDEIKLRVSTARVLEVFLFSRLVAAATAAERADLSWADLSRADLFGANLSRASLSRADLFGANLSWADLSRADLSGADLSWANLSWADPTGANLSGANLSGANLSRANLSGANLSGADLYGALGVSDADRKRAA